MHEPKPSPTTLGPRWRGRLSISFTLAGSLMLVVLLSVGTVLGLSIWSARENTLSLLADKARLMTQLAVDRVEGHLRPAEQQATLLGEALSEGTVDLSRRQDVERYLAGALAAVSQVRSVGFIDRQFDVFAMVRGPDGIRSAHANLADDLEVQRGMQRAHVVDGLVWGAPLWRPGLGETVLSALYPVRRDGTLAGLATATIPVHELSQLLAELDPDLGSNVFVLYDRTSVLAHPLLAGDYPDLGPDRPLPLLQDFGDPVLTRIWDEESREQVPGLDLGAGLESFTVDAFNERYVFLFREIPGPGGRQMQVGTYFEAAEVNAELTRLLRTALAGLAFALLAVLLANWIGRRIARPIVSLSRSASAVGELELSRVEPLPGSVFRELDDQARAFNTMLGGLHWFETYVPKGLVRQLVRRGDAGEIVSEEREVTVLFTDIAGFSAMAAGEPAADVASFLNDHFAMVAACVEAEGGTVDKYIGDSLMAFWNAPDDQPDHSERACRAAVAIARAVERDNEARAGRGRPPIGLRVGLHRGPVVVGNIGAPSRINYTIVGEAVNVGQRIEQLGRDLYAPGSRIVALASAAVCETLPGDFAPRPVPLGPHALRALDEPMEIYRLV